MSAPLKVPRWLALAGPVDTVRLMPVPIGSSGPDVFCKLRDAERAIEAERANSASLLSALQRLFGNFEGLLAGTPVRDVEETIAEVRTALREATP